MLNDLLFALNITAPIFCIIVFGALFKKIGWITEEFARAGSSLVFNVTLPCLLFVKLVETDFRHGLPLTLVGYAILATLVVFILLELLAGRLVTAAGDRGAFVQGAFRSNMGIIGLAYCLSAFGDAVISIASIYLAVLTILFNILAIITLTRNSPQPAERQMGPYLLVSIVKNPLIISIALGMTLSILSIPVPGILLETGGYLARMTLPLALLCAGATIRTREFASSPPLYWASGAKLFLVPLLITAGGVAIGLRGPSLGVLFLMSAAPTAAASYPMAQALKANYHLAAAIIAATSAGSIASATLGLFILRSLSLI